MVIVILFEGALELEKVEVKVQLGDEKSVENLIPKQVLKYYKIIIIIYNRVCVSIAIRDA